MFVSFVTVVIFYYIDMMAFIDIIVRYIADLLFGDKVFGGGCNGDGSCVEIEIKWGDMILNGDEG